MEVSGGHRLGLPEAVRACLFDLDGVLTRTAQVHAAAWKDMFDGFLRSPAEAAGEEFVPFDLGHDYEQYVDGKPRADARHLLRRSKGHEAHVDFGSK